MVYWETAHTVPINHREFDPDAVRRLKGNAKHDITVDGPEHEGFKMKALSLLFALLLPLAVLADSTAKAETGRIWITRATIISLPKT